MLIFGLCSTSDDWLSNKSQPKCGKRPPKSSKNEILIFILHSTSDDQPSDPSDESWSKCKKRNVISVRVFCCFSLGLLYSPQPPPPRPNSKVGIRVTEKFWFFRFTFNKFQPKNNSVQSLLHLLAMQLFVMGNVPIGSSYTFTIYSIRVMANLST